MSSNSKGSNQNMNQQESTIQDHDSNKLNHGHLVNLQSRPTPTKISIPRRQQHKRHQQLSLQQRRRHRATNPQDFKNQLMVRTDQSAADMRININISYSDQETDVSLTDLSTRLQDIAPPSPPLEDDEQLDDRIHGQETVKVIKNTSNANMDSLMRLINVIRNGTYEEFLKILHSRVMNKYLLNIFVDGQTALHYSLMRGRNLAWCKELISCGSNPDLMNQDGWHPIHLAAYSGLHETMLYLIDLCDDCQKTIETKTWRDDTESLPDVNPASE